MSELPRRLVVPITAKDKDGNEHEVDRIVYVRERTCHKKHREDGYDFCSECGWNITCSNDRYCPNCGARIEQGQGRLDI